MSSEISTESEENQLKNKIGFQAIRLQHFQTHKKLLIEFDPQITTIVGPSDAGKSAIIRALSLVCLNRPNGVAFVREGSYGCVVTLTVDGHKIKRKRGPDLNYYSLDGKEFKAFGKGKVPEAIEELLNVGEVNFQWQLDSPYWFTQTPGQVSRNLNQIVNLGIIDSTISKIATEVRSARSEIEVTRGRVLQAKEMKEDLAWVEEIKRDYDELSDAYKEHEKNRISGDLLRELVESVTTHTDTKTICYNAITELEEIIKVVKKYNDISKERVILNKVVKELKQINQIIQQEIPDTTKLIKVRKYGDQVAENCRELRSYIEEIQEGQKTLQKTEELLNTLESKLSKFKVCTTCGQKIKKLSPLSLPTYTCLKKHPYQEPKKNHTSGWPELNNTSMKSPTLQKTSTAQ